MPKKSSSSKGKFPQREEELSYPLESWLKDQGYQVNQEVQSCDLTALKGDELILLELKLRFSLTLVYQALERKALSPSVYIAIPLQGSRTYPAQFKRMKMLLQELQIGLIFVRYLRSGPRVEVVIHPREYRKRSRPKAKGYLLREISRRYGEFNRGGQNSRMRRITAYRQECLHLAWLLERFGSLSPKELRANGGPVRCQGQLSQNLYGWFNRVERGVYTLDQAGTEALKAYADVVESLEAKWDAALSSQS